MLIGWRTLLASGIIAVLGVLQGLDWVTLVESPSSFGWTGVAMAVAMAVMRALTTTPVMKDNAVASVDSTPGVAGVITTQTPEGRALAASIPSPTVAVAGTPKAAEVAMPRTP